MILGFVSPDGRPFIDVHLHYASGLHRVEAWMDTGFDGFLMLPRAEIEQLQLAPSVVVIIELADGSQVEAQSYTASIEWHDQHQRIQVIETQGHILAGLRLLQNQELRISFFRGGTVQIEPIE